MSSACELRKLALHAACAFVDARVDTLGIPRVSDEVLSEAVAHARAALPRLRLSARPTLHLGRTNIIDGVEGTPLPAAEAVLACALEHFGTEVGPTVPQRLRVALGAGDATAEGAGAEVEVPPPPSPLLMACAARVTAWLKETGSRELAKAKTLAAAANVLRPVIAAAAAEAGSTVDGEDDNERTMLFVAATLRAAAARLTLSSEPGGGGGGGVGSLKKVIHDNNDGCSGSANESGGVSGSESAVGSAVEAPLVRLVDKHTSRRLLVPLAFFQTRAVRDRLRSLGLASGHCLRVRRVARKDAMPDRIVVMATPATGLRETRAEPEPTSAMQAPATTGNRPFLEAVLAASAAAAVAKARTAAAAAAAAASAATAAAAAAGAEGASPVAWVSVPVPLAVVGRFVGRRGARIQGLKAKLLAEWAARSPSSPGAQSHLEIMLLHPTPAAVGRPVEAVAAIWWWPTHAATAIASASDASATLRAACTVAKAILRTHLTAAARAAASSSQHASARLLVASAAVDEERRARLPYLEDLAWFQGASGKAKHRKRITVDATASARTMRKVQRSARPAAAAAAAARATTDRAAAAITARARVTASSATAAGSVPTAPIAAAAEVVAADKIAKRAQFEALKAARKCRALAKLEVRHADKQRGGAARREQRWITVDCWAA